VYGDNLLYNFLQAAWDEGSCSMSYLLFYGGGSKKKE